MPLKEFFGRIRQQEQDLLGVIEGVSSITPELADSFEKELGISASFWQELHPAQCHISKVVVARFIILLVKYNHFFVNDQP